jgi:hypothetical protein
LKERTFSTLDEQNAHLLRWNERWAATRIHGTTKRQVREMFDEERSTLGALPLSRFEYYRILERRVHLDGHVEVDGAYYSAPARFGGTSVVVHAGRLWLRILDPNGRELVREHEITKRGSRRTAEADRPKQTPPKIEHLVEKIARHGPACGAFARAAVDEQARSLHVCSSASSTCYVDTVRNPSNTRASSRRKRIHCAIASCARTFNITKRCNRSSIGTKTSPKLRPTPSTLTP